MKLLIVSFAALALAGPAHASMQTTATSQAPAEEAEDASQNRVVCKREKVTGSRLGSREICRTEAQWNQIRQDERQALERGQANRPTSGN